MRKFVWAGVACIAVIVAIGAYNIIASQVLDGPVNGRSLYVSVADESGGTDPRGADEHERCHRTAQLREWRCDIPFLASPSGDSGYRVRMRPDSSCWDAEG